MKVIATLVAASLAVASAQQVGTYSVEAHPAFPIESCTKAGCTTEDTSLVMDVQWRWLHTVGGYSACLDSGAWTCGNATACAQNCAYEGIDAATYNATYGVTTAGNEVSMKYNAKQTGSRLYLTTKDEKYRMFKLLNKELTFDVDTADLLCGMNGALYLVEMAADGGMSLSPDNKIGAKLGMGYCDAQCSTGIPFVAGQANQNNLGQCCAEFDLWEANKAATVYTSHPSLKPGIYSCSTDCNDITAKYGCGFNPYANGNKTFYGSGPEFTVDTSKKITVVTQFVTDDNTATGNLVDIRRVWVQEGKVIANSVLAGTNFDSLDEPYCSKDGPNTHSATGGIKGMGEALGRGMVLAFATWTDSNGLMTWLDAGANGPCPDTESGGLAALQTPGSTLKFSKIRVGDIGSTFASPTPTPTATTPKPTTTKPTTTKVTTKPTTTKVTTKPTTTKVTTKPVPTTTAAPTTTPTPTTSGQAKWGQCGGIGWTGPTTCKEGTCTKLNDWYFQCL